MNRTAPVFSIGTRAAGAVIVVGYLSGLVPGAIVSIVGGLALMTFGRALLLDRDGSAVSGAALAIAAGALGVGALRWGTLEIEGIVGAQSVLGPTVMVGPTAAAAASGAAMAAGVIAFGVWSAPLRLEGRRARLWGLFEVVLAIVAVVAAFAIPAAGGGTGLGAIFEAVGRDPLEWAAWAGALVVSVAVAIGVALLVHRRRSWRWVVLAITGVAVMGAAGTMASVL